MALKRHTALSCSCLQPGMQRRCSLRSSLQLLCSCCSEKLVAAACSDRAAVCNFQLPCDAVGCTSPALQYCTKFKLPSHSALLFQLLSSQSRAPGPQPPYSSHV